MAQLYIDNAKKLKVRIDNNQKIVDTVEAAGGIETTLTQSDKIGFDWLNFYVNKVLVRQEYKEQDNPVGTADNPFVWEKAWLLSKTGSMSMMVSVRFGSARQALPPRGTIVIGRSCKCKSSH